MFENHVCIISANLFSIPCVNVAQCDICYQLPTDYWNSLQASYISYHPFKLSTQRKYDQIDYSRLNRNKQLFSGTFTPISHSGEYEKVPDFVDRQPYLKLTKWK